MSWMILKTGTLRVATVWFWNCLMCSIAWRNQICHTTSTGCCRTRCLIRLPKIARSSENVRNHDFGSVSVRFRVTIERENRRPDKNAHPHTRLLNMLSHMVQSDFSHDHGNIQQYRALGNPVKCSQIPSETPKILENFTIKHHQFSPSSIITLDTSNKHNIMWVF